MTQSIALVTGAARGIGLATTKQFLSDGRYVIMVDRDREALLSEAAKLENVAPMICDVSHEDEVQALVRKVAEFGPIGALINNAGVADFGPIEDTSFARWRTVMETNLDGVFLMTQAFTPMLKDTKGAIVNIASISGLRASTLRVAYGTSKAAEINSASGMG